MATGRIFLVTILAMCFSSGVLAELPQEVIDCFGELDPVVKRLGDYYVQCTLDLVKEDDTSANTEEVEECFNQKKEADKDGEALIAKCAQLVGALPHDQIIEAGERFSAEAKDEETWAYL